MDVILHINIPTIQLIIVALCNMAKSYKSFIRMYSAYKVVCGPELDTAVEFGGTSVEALQAENFGNANCKCKFRILVIVSIF